MKMDDALFAFYERHLTETVLPFWLNNGPDEEYGGFYTCFDNTTGALLSTDKYIWSQGRMAWVAAKLSTMQILDRALRERLLGLGKKTAEFLMHHARSPGGDCYFLTTRAGAPKPAYADGDLCPSIYADCFVVLGLARYAAVAGDGAALSFAGELYASIAGRLRAGSYKTLPYPEIRGYRTHGINMIFNDVSRELSAAMAAAGVAGAGAVFANAVDCAKASLGLFAAAGPCLREMVPVAGGVDDTTLVGRYINPGHSLEDLWFIIHAALRSGDGGMAQQACRLIGQTFDTGWDDAYGGLFTFCDHLGGAPKGETDGHEGEAMVQKIRADWQNKLWWPHSEGLYALLLAHSHTGDEAFMRRYTRLHDYVFATFPDRTGAGREWVQIRTRQGAPENKVVALPVKDPYHIIRNLALVLDLAGGTAGVV